MIVPFEKIRTWRERIGQSAEFPLHVPTDVERAMVAEIADLRVAVEQTQVSAAAFADRFAEARLDDFFATTFGTNDPACHDYATLKMGLKRLRASEGQAQTSGDSVPVPQNIAQAELMQKMGLLWLQFNAPHRLTEAGRAAQLADSTGGVKS